MAGALGVGAAVFLGGPVIGGAIAAGYLYSKRDKKPKKDEASKEESKEEQSAPGDEQAASGEQVEIEAFTCPIT